MRRLVGSNPTPAVSEAESRLSRGIATRGRSSPERPRSSGVVQENDPSHTRGMSSDRENGTRIVAYGTELLVLVAFILSA
jgi:hypothetical protein